MAEDCIIAGATLHRAFEALAAAIAQNHVSTASLFVVGIANGGIPFSRKLPTALTQRLGRTIPCGSINPMFHRDDVGQHPIPKSFNATEFSFDTDKASVIPADDVIASRQTVYGALNELFDQGRPACVQLAVLFDRGNGAGRFNRTTMVSVKPRPPNNTSKSSSTSAARKMTRFTSTPLP